MYLNVLIIEDESIVALHIKRTVSALGHKTLKVAKSSTDALEIAKNNIVDLVISDVNIEGDVDGIECSEILQETYNTPIIFVTAYKDMATLVKASKLNFVGYLVKPFREDELETIINLAILKYNLLPREARYIIDDIYSYCHKTNDLLRENKAVVLTKKKNQFLLSLIKANGSVVFYCTLEHNIWNSEPVGESTRRQLVHRFKQKAPNFPLTLIKGVGYKLEV